MSAALTAIEARVVAALTEKSLTTPDYYPMTVNGLVAASNQKTSRWPVMSLSEGEVGNALLTLAEKRFVGRDDSIARATRWRSQFMHQLLLKPASQAVLLTLMLRGPQTVAELRGNAQPLRGPDDAEGVQAVLGDLADRAEPLVVLLPRQAGQAAARYAHLMCGDPPASVTAAAEGVAPRPASGLEARVAALEARVAALESQLLSGNAAV